MRRILRILRSCLLCPRINSGAHHTSPSRFEEVRRHAPGFARHALRITQESPANVIRHAHATKVRVSCKFVPSVNRVVLEVFDNGKGMALEHVPPSGGRGLQGMRQRALDAGGSLQISSQLGSGTLVQLTLEFTPAKLHNLSADRPANTGVFRPAVF